MIAISIILVLLSVVLSCFLLHEGREKAKLAELYGVMKGRVEAQEEAAEKAASSESEQKEEDHLASSKPLSPTSIRTALRFNGFSPETGDCREPNIIYFKIGDTNCRVNAERLPLLSLEVAYRFDEPKENIDLLCEAASEVTSKMYVAKACIAGEDAEAVIVSAEFICDTYTYLRDNLKEYLNLLRDAYKRYFSTYESLKQKRKNEREAVFSGRIYIPHSTQNKIQS